MRDNSGLGKSKNNNHDPTLKEHEAGGKLQRPAMGRETQEPGLPGDEGSEALAPRD